jgi:hypothetical protein
MTVLTEQQKELKVQKGIRDVEDDLVKAIQKLLDDRSSYGDLEESQFRNLVRVSDTTESPEVIKNFLLYQLGRYASSDRKWGRGQNSLAQKIIEDIDKLIKKKAEEIAGAAKVDNSKPIHIELIRRYLGYGVRYLTYLRKGES